jgi:hypothetical protein
MSVKAFQFVRFLVAEETGCPVFDHLVYHNAFIEVTSFKVIVLQDEVIIGQADGDIDQCEGDSVWMMGAHHFVDVFPHGVKRKIVKQRPPPRDPARVDSHRDMNGDGDIHQVFLPTEQDGNGSVAAACLAHVVDGQVAFVAQRH